MGILTKLGLSRSRLDYLASPIDLGIASPWQEGNLAQIVPSDIFGSDLTDKFPMTRAEAITIPAVSKARNLLVSTLGKFPLRALSADGSMVKTQPTFLYRTDSAVTPYERMAWTTDDLIFYGYSLWVIERGANGQITNAEYCPIKDWKITDGHILVNDKPVDESSVIFFNSPFEGLLNIANRTLRGARDTEEAWVARMKNPVPLTELRVTNDDNLTQEEVDAYVLAWGKKHRSSEPAVGMTPMGMEMHTHGEVHADLFVAGRNTIRTDVGSFLNIRASMLDGTSGIDSLTYTTKDGERNAFYDIDLPFWTDPIAHRLSMDDVVPRGQRVRFDFYEAYNFPAPTGPNVED